MPTYVYETTGKTKKRRYEIRHGINEAPLKRHPKTGEPIRRVIAAGAGILTSKAPAPSRAQPAASCCCGPGGCCPH
jgi:hypothetical protein